MANPEFEYFVCSNSWTGSASMLWSNAANWSAGIPDASDDVSIPDVTINPTIGAAGALAKSIKIESGGALTYQQLVLSQ